MNSHAFVRPLFRTRTASIALLALALTTSAAQAAFDNINQQGLTGHWSNPDIHGQGIIFEVYATPTGGRIVGTWHTFDTVAAPGYDKQRWYTFTGDVKNGSSVVTLELRSAFGGNFDAAPEPVSISVGSASLQFDSCSSGRLEYSFDDGRTGNIPLTRSLSNVACESVDGGGKPIPQFGLSGNWYRAETPGQGIVLEVNPVAGKTRVGWFTFAADGSGAGMSGQRWFSAEGEIAPDSTSVSLPLFHTVYGTFNSNATLPTTYRVGTVTLDFIDCQTVIYSYAFNTAEFAGRSGTMVLQRSGATPAICAITEGKTTR